MYLGQYKRLKETLQSACTEGYKISRLNLNYKYHTDERLLYADSNLETLI